MEAYSAATSSDGEPFAPSSGNHIPQAFCAPDRMTAFSRLSRFGMIVRPLTADRGEELLTWFLAGFPVRTSAQQDEGPESTARNPECGNIWRELLAKYDPNTHTLKTAQFSLFEDLTESSPTLPRWGSMQNGELFQQPTLVPRTGETESGLLPTPNCPNGGRSVAHVTDWRGRTAYHKGKKVQFGLESAVRIWPTPTSTLGTNGGLVTPAKAREGGTLIEALSARTLWPTPTASDNRPRGTQNSTARRMALGKQVGLEAMVKWATPTAHNAKEAACPAEYLRATPTLAAQAGGALNPDWVEWLMNWPIKWSSLDALDPKEFSRWKKASAAQVSGSAFMRTVWWDSDPSQTSHGQRPDEQREQEHCDSVRKMPRVNACEPEMARSLERETVPLLRTKIFICAAAGKDVQPGMREQTGVDEASIIPRVATRVIARVDRLKAIGNGQVPAVAATAWRLLNHY